jgi:uncharacterized membrane protein
LPELTREELIGIVKQHRPSNLASLKKFLNEANMNVSDEKLLPLIKQLQSEGTLKFSVQHTGSFNEYLADIWNAWWFYLVIVVTLSELFLVISNSQAGVPLVLRILFGLGVLGIIPGFLTVMIIFPGGQVQTLEKIALSIFLSVLISITVGVLLGLGPFFQASNNIIVLTVYVVLADVAASYRTYDFLKRSH